MNIKVYWYGFGPEQLDSNETTLLSNFAAERQAQLSHIVLPSLTTQIEAPQNGDLHLGLVVAPQIMKGKHRFTPVNWKGNSYSHGRLVVVVGDPNLRGNLIDQSIAWMKIMSQGTETGELLINHHNGNKPQVITGYRQSQNGGVMHFPWGPDKGTGSLHVERENAHGKGGRLTLSTTKQTASLTVNLTAAQLLKEASLVALLGAFNLEVGLSMDAGQLHLTFLQLRKRLALVAEAAHPGAGAEIFKLIQQLTTQQLQNREEVMPLFEAILLFGKIYEQLSDEERQIADQFQLADEQSHFSRIMDVDALRNGVKRQVGTVDAGNPLIARMLMNAARYREDLGLITYYPLPHNASPEAAGFVSATAMAQTRTAYPYTSCIITTSDSQLTRDLMEIYRRLITQYPLEISFLMMEEWIMYMGIDDPAISLTAAQVVQQNEQYELKIVNAGGGLVVVKNSQATVMHHFEASGESYGQGQLAVGRIDFQQIHHIKVLNVAVGDEVMVFPQGTQISQSEAAKLTLAQNTGFKVNPKKHTPLTVFEWTEPYIQATLSAVVEQIAALGPKRIDIQFGHVHGDRDPGKDQEVGAYIAGVFARMLQAHGLYIETRPMSDNYHVVDRLNFPFWTKLLQEHSGLDITEVTFEDALISRHLGDEATARLFRMHPDQIVRQGVNYYFRPQEVAGMMVELYDGVTDPSVCARMACVNFQIGYELYRLNPALANALYKQYLFENFPNSLAVKWWKEWPEATYQELMLKHVYLLPAEQRMDLKAKVDEEIDRPFAVKCQSGQTPLLDQLLPATDLNEVVLIHILEGFYDAQERKSAALWQALELPGVHQWRVSFNRHTGELKALDWNRHLK